MITVACIGELNTDYFHLFKEELLNYIDVENINVIVFLNLIVGNMKSLEYFMKFMKDLRKREKDAAILTTDDILKYSHNHTFTSAELKDIVDGNTSYYFAFVSDDTTLNSIVKKKKKRKLTINDVKLIFSRKKLEFGENSHLICNEKNETYIKNYHYVKSVSSLEPTITIINLDGENVSFNEKCLRKIEICELDRSKSYKFEC